MEVSKYETLLRCTTRNAVIHATLFVASSGLQTESARSVRRPASGGKMTFSWATPLRFERTILQGSRRWRVYMVGTDDGRALGIPCGVPLIRHPARVQAGTHCKPTPSPTAQSISATRSGRIIPLVSTACARREGRVRHGASGPASEVYGH